MLQKIEALLRKAESTHFEEEAAAFYAKAQELMEKYAISEEALWKLDPSKSESPILETVHIKGDAAYDKFVLLSTLAQVNRCQAWKNNSGGRRDRSYDVRIAGYPSDIAFVTALYASLLLQLDLACVLAEVEEDYIESLRTWRISFTEAYCSRVSRRLLEQHKRRQEPSTGSSKELVLAREKKVEDYVTNELGLVFHTLNFNRNSFDSRAYSKGQEAGDQADIGTTRLPNRRRELE